MPFLEHGRDRDGWDCWGLICCGYRDVLGIEIPRYSGAYGSAQDHRRVACLFRDRDAEAWREVEREVGAIALLRRRGVPIHVGLAVGKRDILHCEIGVGTVIEPARNLRIDSYWSPAWTAR